MPPIFRLLQERGGIARDEMFRAFNMGIGLVVVCAARDAERVDQHGCAAGEPNAVRLGVVVAGDRGVQVRCKRGRESFSLLLEARFDRHTAAGSQVLRDSRASNSMPAWSLHMARPHGGLATRPALASSSGSAAVR